MFLFHFSQYLKKFNSIDNEYDDTIEFAVWKKFVFRPELSNGLTGEEVVTTLHPGKNSLLFFSFLALHKYIIFFIQ